MNSPSSPNARDGLIDFSKYSTEQLFDLRETIDGNSFPLNHRKLVAELERRQNAEAAEGAGPAADRWQVRFTGADGVLGWIEALRKRQPLYGEGWAELGAEEAFLHGWQRTWLGIAIQRTISVPYARIRNVGRNTELLRLERKGRFGSIAFAARSAEEASQIASHLPQDQTAGFEQRWAELSRFYRLLDAAGAYAWVTATIVAANLLIFAAMAIQQKRFAAFDLQVLQDWGGNYGILTANGQWWRLLSATFLHLDPAHVLVNMWALWSVGKLTERLYGRWVFFGLYLASGVVASLTSIVWDPARVTVGASGAIFGIFGAFLAYLVQRRTDVPKSIIRAHWLSTTVFVLFSLTSGLLQTGIDNAAHIGGLTAGFLLGWCVARPLDARMPLSPRQIGTAIAILVVAATAGILQTRGAGSQLTEIEQYFQAHDWYVRGEQENLRQWQGLASRSAAGAISNLELGYQFENNILPFWVASGERLKKEDAALPKGQARFAPLLLEYVETRRAWASAVISANKDRNGKTAADIQELAFKADKVTARIQRLSLRERMAHRPQALSNSTVVTYIRGRLLAANWDCIRRPYYFGQQVSASDLKDDGPAMADAIGCRAQRAFATSDFPELEAMLNDYGKVLNDLPHDGSRLAAAFGGLGNMFEFGRRDLLEDLGRTADWRRAYPKSVFPDLVDASIFHESAWAARGSGTADTISPQMSALYNFRTEMAAAALEDMKADGTSSPYWYELSLEVGVDQSIGLPALRALFDEGNMKFPAYLPLYRAMLRPLLPRWEGSYEEAHVFIDDMQAKAGSDDGDRRYAMLWWLYGHMEEDRDNVFDTAPVEWPRVKTGFRALISHHPESDYLVNAFAHMACQADAVTEYVELRPALDKRLSATVWSESVSLKSCDDKFKEALQVAHISH